MKIHSVDAELYLEARQTVMIKQTVTFCNFVNVPNKETLPYFRSCDEDTDLKFQVTQKCF